MTTEQVEIEDKPKYKIIQVIEEHSVQRIYEVKVPVVYLEEWDYEPMTWCKVQKDHVSPEDAAAELTSEDNHIDDNWEFRETLETNEVER